MNLIFRPKFPQQIQENFPGFTVQTICFYRLFTLGNCCHSRLPSANTPRYAEFSLKDLAIRGYKPQSSLLVTSNLSESILAIVFTPHLQFQPYSRSLRSPSPSHFLFHLTGYDAISLLPLLAIALTSTSFLTRAAIRQP